MDEPTDAARLAAQARTLGNQVQMLGVSVDELAHRTNRAERITLAVVIGLLLDLVLSIAVGFGLWAQANTNDQLGRAVAREAATRQDAICPLYALIIGNFNPESRPAGPARDQYVASFDVLRAGYESLDCTQPLVPPAAPR